MPSLRLIAPSAGALAAAFASLRAELELVAEFPAAVESEALRISTEQRLPEADATDIPFVTVDPVAGTRVRVVLEVADIPTRTVRFRLA